MFDGLREKLRSVQEAFGTSMRAASAPPAGGGGGDGPGAKAAPGLGERVKILVTEGELVLSEKQIEAPLQELELVLLENDVALPVTDEILRVVKADLAGKRRSIGEAPEKVVLAALRDALVRVLGEGFDLPAYLRGRGKPVK